MRRIAALTLATGVALTSMGALATGAEAKPKGWTSPKGFKNVSAKGVYSKGNGRVIVSGKLRDHARDKKTACVEIKFVGRTRSETRRVHIVKADGVTLFDGPTVVKFGPYTSTLTKKLQVRECTVVKKGKRNVFKYSKFKTIYG